MRQKLVVCRLGRVDYDSTWELQHRLQQRLIRAKREKPYETLPHLLLIVEHSPVYTIGKSGNPDHLLASEATLKDRDARFIQVDRGGDITFHGPGQVVGYPILDLDRIFTDLHKYLRTLEEVIIQTCGVWGIDGFRVDGRTGVWVGDATKNERKICAFGVRCSRWVTMHGWALNVNTDLTYFDHIVPCGIEDRGVTSLHEELGTAVFEEDVEREAIDKFASCFDLSFECLDKKASRGFLDNFAPAEDVGRE